MHDAQLAQARCAVESCVSCVVGLCFRKQAPIGYNTFHAELNKFRKAKAKQTKFDLVRKQNPLNMFLL